MPVMKVNVMWNKNVYKDVELDTDETALAFKTQLYTLTNVEPNRQKVMIKGAGLLKDDHDWSKIKLKDGLMLRMMGTPSGGEIKEPEKKTLFLEDMGVNPNLAVYPPGLNNLGNTCYMNATIQCLKTAKGLQNALEKYEAPSNGGEVSHRMIGALRGLFKLLNTSLEPVPPVAFLQLFRAQFPIFAQQGPHGGYMQQDADECWGQVLRVLKDHLPAVEDGGIISGGEASALEMSASSEQPKPKSFIEQFFFGSYECQTKCIEATDEVEITSMENFEKLVVHINKEVNFLLGGLKEQLQNDTFMKHSPSLDRNATYSKYKRVSRLPAYLTVQFMRFFWKAGEDGGTKSKITRPVKFPASLDLHDVCTPELKERLKPYRERMQRAEDQKLADKKKRAEMKLSNDSMDTSPDVPPEEFFSFPDDVGSNCTANYELSAVLTHKGRSADQGHYVGWVRHKDDDWLKYDDDTVTSVKTEDVLKLNGGSADWHIAYICFYTAKTIPVNVE